MMLFLQSDDAEKHSVTVGPESISLHNNARLDAETVSDSCCDTVNSGCLTVQGSFLWLNTFHSFETPALKTCH